MYDMAIPRLYPIAMSGIGWHKSGSKFQYQRNHTFQIRIYFQPAEWTHLVKHVSPGSKVQGVPFVAYHHQRGHNLMLVNCKFNLGSAKTLENQWIIKVHRVPFIKNINRYNLLL